MPACEFNERQYEFCANYQLQNTLGAYLVGGMPSIPSQVDEALKGYDAAYEFHSGRLLYIQYKVAHFSPHAHGRGAATYKLWAAPYYRAKLHRDRYGRCTQHNALISLTSPTAVALYVSPAFVTNSDLRACFAQGSGNGVFQESVLAPLTGLPRINDTEAHSITYPEDVSAFRVHSEASPPYETLSSITAALERVEEEEWTEGFFSTLRDHLNHELLSQDVLPPENPAGGGFDGPLAEIAAILDQRLGAVMALVPSERDDAPR